MKSYIVGCLQILGYSQSIAASVTKTVAKCNTIIFALLWNANLHKHLKRLCEKQIYK